MRKSWLISWLLLAFAGACALPARARACTCSGSPIYRSDPEDGAQDVPLNAALLVLGAFPVESLTLEDEDGQAVEFTLHAGPTPSCAGTSADLVPMQPLKPGTTYVLEVEPLYPSSGEPSSTRFTTGTAWLPDLEPEPPTASASVFLDVPPDGFSCGDGTVRAFIDVPDWEGVEVIARRGDTVLLHWMLLAGEGGFKLESAPDCLEFRRRAPNGRRSAPVALCGDALAERPFPGAGGVRDAGTGAPSPPVEPRAITQGAIRGAEGTSWGTSAAMQSPSHPQADGCSAAPGARRRSGVGLVMLLALAGLARRSRGAAERVSLP
jgi:hypothetical protein